MTAPERRLAALAALFAPERAAALLARLPEPAAAEAAAFAARLAVAPRRERLHALAAALRADAAAVRARARKAAESERPRVARVLRALGEGASPGDGVAPWIVRLCRERIGR